MHKWLETPYKGANHHLQLQRFKLKLQLDTTLWLWQWLWRKGKQDCDRGWWRGKTRNLSYFASGRSKWRHASQRLCGLSFSVKHKLNICPAILLAGSIPRETITFPHKILGFESGSGDMFAACAWGPELALSLPALALGLQHVYATQHCVGHETGGSLEHSVQAL